MVCAYLVTLRACSAGVKVADHSDTYTFPRYCFKAIEDPKEKNLLSATGEHPNVLSCGGNNASDGFGFILGKLRLHNKYNDTPPPSCAWTMFSVQTHYRKCKHLTECHSQGYCLSALLAAHLHGADQALKHNLPQKTSPAAIFRRASCTAGE